MFEKKCKRCARKIDKDYEFCPYCGFNIKKDEELKNFGLLGKDDIAIGELGLRMPFGFDRIFSSLMNQIDRQFREMDREMGKEMKIPKEKKSGVISRGISINISTGTGKKPEIKISGFGPGFENLKKEEKEIKIKKPEISEEKARELARLPRQEAETKVRRLSNKVIYEISLPGIKKLDNVMINKLENSIEIKAFSKEKVYFKLLPINLPLINYKLEDEKLILELKAR